MSATVSVVCQNCGSSLKAPRQAAGKTAPCPKCKRPVTVRPVRTAAPAPTVRDDTQKFQWEPAPPAPTPPTVVYPRPDFAALANLPDPPGPVRRPPRRRGGSVGGAVLSSILCVGLAVVLGVVVAVIAATASNGKQSVAPSTERPLTDMERVERMHREQAQEAEALRLGLEIEAAREHDRRRGR